MHGMVDTDNVTFGISTDIRLYNIARESENASLRILKDRMCH